MKGRPKININHLLFIHTIFQAKESSDNRHLLPTGYVAIITRSFHVQNFYQRPNHNSVKCVQPNGYNLFVVSHLL